jgi:uncharacterized protein YqjF (DUF2071 family)
MASDFGRLVGKAIGMVAEAFVDTAGREMEPERLPPDDHRPWPIPTTPWAIAQTWAHSLFAHWRLPPADVQRVLPRGLHPDVIAGSAWVGVVAFAVSGARLRGAPAVPGFSEFAEVNVRTYVTIDDKPGVYFFSLDAASVVSVAGAAPWFRLPYFFADATIRPGRRGIRFTSERRHPGAAAAAFSATYHATGRVAPPRRRSLAWHLTERYCLYTVDDGTIARVEVHHPRWPLQRATARIARNTLGDPLGLDLSGPPDLVHFASRVDAVAWAPVALPASAGASAAG